MQRPRNVYVYRPNGIFIPQYTTGHYENTLWKLFVMRMSHMITRCHGFLSPYSFRPLTVYNKSTAFCVHQMFNYALTELCYDRLPSNGSTLQCLLWRKKWADNYPHNSITYMIYIYMRPITHWLFVKLRPLFPIISAHIFFSCSFKSIVKSVGMDST